MNLQEFKKGQEFKNYQGEKLTIKQINFDFKNGGNKKEYDFFVEIDGAQYWFNDSQLFNFINN